MPARRPHHPRPVTLALTTTLLVAAACGAGGTGPEPAALPTGPDAAADVELTAFVDAAGRACEDRFVDVELPHTTLGPGDTSSTFDGTGSGVAIGDLDDDGDLDLVLANLSGETSILWNDGGLSFRPEPLVVGRFRQPAIVDVDGDGDLDVVLSTGVGPPIWFERGDDGTFTRDQLDGVDAATYSLAWGDLGGDGDLDLVTGSYNAELAIVRNSPVLGSDTGVVVNERGDDGAFAATRIAAEAQALAIRLVDVDGDGRSDIVVGNDLATPDGVWLDNRGGWLPVEPFAETTFSTMSLDAGDVDGDGRFDVLATDMAPRPDDDEADVRYAEVDADMAAIGQVGPTDGGTEQIPENTLGFGSADGFENRARDLGIDATGWSWSGLLGDLDADGNLDVHITTGMRSDQLFDFLDNDELIEPNAAFRGTGAGGGAGFEPVPSWGLNSEVGGRGSALGDLDGDGDLDLVVNNLGSPSVVHENRLCGGSSLLVEPRWPGSANPFAIGATVYASGGDRRWVTAVDATRGYLSGGTVPAHVGLGDVTEVELLVRWPDGAITDLGIVAADQHLRVTRR
ncbi:MAG: CRTAC1 family protein [Actinomycetota bacterium]